MNRPRIEVAIEPLEPMLFGDNRSARAGEDHALADQDPSPATFYGAVGGRIAAAVGAVPRPGRWAAAEPYLGPLAATLEDRPEERAQLLGVTLADRHGEPWFPRPLHLRLERLDSGLERVRDLLAPAVDGTGGVLSSLGGFDRLVPADGPEEEKEEDVAEVERDRWVDTRLLAAALTGATVQGVGEVATAERFYRSENRVGLTLRNERNAAHEGRLFGRPFRRFAGGLAQDGGGWRGAGFRAWFAVLALDPRGAAAWSGEGFLGGDRGRARLDFTAPDGEPLAGLRDAVLAAAEGDGTDGFLAYLLTPAVATARPPGRAGQPAVAYAVGKPLHASGWNRVAGRPRPRPVRTLLPAGSVYFYRWPEAADGARRREIVAALWLGSLDPALEAAGFGRILPGVWRARR